MVGPAGEKLTREKIGREKVSRSRPNLPSFFPLVFLFALDKKFFMFSSIHDHEVGTYAEIASLL